MPRPDPESAPTTSTPFVSRKRILWAIVATASFSVPIAWTLASPPSPEPVETQMVPDDSGGESFLIPFTDISPAGKNERVHRMSLNSPALMEVLQHPEIRILFSLDERRLQHPATGRLEVVGTLCVYETPGNSSIADGRAMTFVRSGRCRPANSHPTGELTLTVTMAGPGQLQLWTRALPIDRGSGGLVYARDPRPQAVSLQPLAVRGAFVDYPPDGGLRRVNLLAYTWTGSVESARIWLAIASVTVLLFAGALVFPVDERSTDGANGRHLLMTGAGGTLCFAAAFALLYAIVVPPMQAADEPHFLVTYGAITGQPWSPQDASRWAKDTQFERIRSHADQRFSPRDIGRPSTAADDFTLQPIWRRSSLTARVWTMLGHMLPPMPVNGTMAVVRAIYAVTFGAAVATAAALLIVSCPVKFPQLLCFPFLFIPTLPFFGMQITEAAVLTSAAVVFASALTVLFIDGRRADWIGIALGLSTAALFLATRSALPVSALLGMMLMARALLGSHDPQRRVGSALVFWGGFALGSATFFALVSPSHLARIDQMLTVARAGLPLPLRPVVATATRAWFPFALAATGCVIEIVAERRRRMLSRTLAPALTKVAVVICVFAAVAILASLVASLWWDYPGIEDIQNLHPPPVREYILQVEATMATMFRLRQPNLLLTSSFWVGFGWLDTIPDAAFCSFLVTSTGLSLAGLLLHIARSGNVRRFVWLASFAIGSAVTLAVYAVSAHQPPYRTNLHGRYLIGWYVPAIAICWTCPAMLGHFGVERRLSNHRPLVFLVLWIAVHTYAACFILTRYF